MMSIVSWEFLRSSCVFMWKCYDKLNLTQVNANHLHYELAINMINYADT